MHIYGETHLQAAAPPHPRPRTHFQPSAGSGQSIRTKGPGGWSVQLASPGELGGPTKYLRTSRSSTPGSRPAPHVRAPAHTHRPRRSLGPVRGGLCGHPISIGKDERLQDTRGLLEGPHCPLVFTEQGGVGRMETNYRPWPCLPRNARHGQDGTSTWPGASSQDPQTA